MLMELMYMRSQLRRSTMRQVIYLMYGKDKIDAKTSNSRSAGNPLATWEREMFQKSHSPVKSGKLGVPEAHPRDVPRQTQ